MTAVTITTSRDAFQQGDVIELSDTRRWWQQLWDWVRRRHAQRRLERRFIVTACVGTVLTVERA